VCWNLRVIETFIYQSGYTGRSHSGSFGAVGVTHNLDQHHDASPVLILRSALGPSLGLQGIGVDSRDVRVVRCRLVAVGSALVELLLAPGAFGVNFCGVTEPAASL